MMRGVGYKTFGTLGYKSNIMYYPICSFSMCIYTYRCHGASFCTISQSSPMPHLPPLSGGPNPNDLYCGYLLSQSAISNNLMSLARSTAISC